MVAEVGRTWLQTSQSAESDTTNLGSHTTTSSSAQSYDQTQQTDETTDKDDWLQREADADYFFNNRNSSFFKKAVFAVGTGVPPTPEQPKSRINSVMTPAMALDTFKDVLNDYECKEIKLCKLVSHVGSAADKDKIRNYFKKYKTFDDVLGRYYLLTHDHLYYRYEIIKELHDGNMAQVVLVYDHERCKKVVAKIFRAERWPKMCADKELKWFWPTVMKRDKDESLVDFLSSNYICPLLNHFVFRGHHVLVMELQSKSLASLIESGVDFSVNNIRLILKQLTAALEFLHNIDLVHGSINPRHVIQTMQKPVQVRLVDFSYSCTEKECKLPLHFPDGHHNYASPELLMGRKYGKPADIWGLACTAAELMTGQKLFKGGSDTEVMTNIAALLGDIAPHLILPEKKSASIRRPKQPYFDPKGVFCFEGKKPERVHLKEILPADKLVDPLKPLLKSSLVYNPLRRPTASALSRSLTTFSTPASKPATKRVNSTVNATPVRKKSRS